MQRKAEKAPKKKTIGDHGREASDRKKKSTRDAVINAMRDMEREIERNNGIYPFTADGQLSIQEVLRRAGKSSAALEKPQHKAEGGLKEIVTEWVTRVNGKITGGVRIVRKMITERVNEADERLSAFMQAWSEAELEYIQAKEDMMEKDKEIAQLKRDIERLKAEIAGTNVVQLHLSEREIN
jgi:uncharacterized membrane-anchored protein